MFDVRPRPLGATRNTWPRRHWCTAPLCTSTSCRRWAPRPSVGPSASSAREFWARVPPAAIREPRTAATAREPPSRARARVRIQRRLVDFDVDRNLVRVEHKGVRLVVDRELVPGLQVQRGSLFQFIGEVTHAQVRASADTRPTRHCPLPPADSAICTCGRVAPLRGPQPQLQLRARVARVVDGLDLELYDMALVTPTAAPRPAPRAGTPHIPRPCPALLLPTVLCSRPIESQVAPSCLSQEARRKFEDEMSAVVGSGDSDAAATTGAAGVAATAGTGAVPMAMQQ
eukprot:COSAG06_NODE_804_length_12172_cov_15.171954_5_plen_286_part_00